MLSGCLVDDSSSSLAIATVRVLLSGHLLFASGLCLDSESDCLSCSSNAIWLSANLFSGTCRRKSGGSMVVLSHQRVVWGIPYTELVKAVFSQDGGVGCSMWPPLPERFLHMFFVCFRSLELTVKFLKLKFNFAFKHFVQRLHFPRMLSSHLHRRNGNGGEAGRWQADFAIQLGNLNMRPQPCFSTCQ